MNELIELPFSHRYFHFRLSVRVILAYRAADATVAG